jgi:hypothetical protein
MFEDLFTRPSALARHRDAPYAEERARYLAYCVQRVIRQPRCAQSQDSSGWLASSVGIPR